MGTIIDPKYMPFTEEELAPHFLSAVPRTHLHHYTSSAQRYNRGRTRSKFDRQIEMDERFWTVAALKHMYDQHLLPQVLAVVFGDVPPVDGLATWEEALGADLKLYFEQDLPSPRAYQEWLRAHLRERQMIPHLLNLAAEEGHIRLEGPTRADALLLNAANGFAVVFEAKVLADVSCSVTYDIMRHQMARDIDALLEDNAEADVAEELRSRDPLRSLYVLLTPRAFYERRTTRLYGWLYEDYKNNPASLGRDLPHRQDMDWGSVSRRLGWLTFEDCNDVAPGCCKWLA